MTAAFWSWVASVLVGLVAIAYSATRFDELHQRLADEVRAQQPDIGAELLNRVVDTTLSIGLAGPAVVLGVQLLLAALMRGRRGWARVALAVVGLLGLLGAAVSLVSLAEQVRLVLPLQALLIVVGTVLMFTPSASTWFRHG